MLIFLCLGEEKHRAEAEGFFGHMHWLVRSLIFESKVMESGALRFDYIAAQAGNSSAGMLENGCRTRTREEAGSFSKKLVKVTSVAWQPQASPHASLHAALHNTTELLAGAVFWSFEAFNSGMKRKYKSILSLLARSAAPGSIYFGSVACSVTCSVACSVA